jgi:hypothetical protein
VREGWSHSVTAIHEDLQAYTVIEQTIHRNLKFLWFSDSFVGFDARSHPFISEARDRDDIPLLLKDKK